MKKLVLSLLLCAFSAWCVAPIVVIVPSYNNIAWYEQNLASICAQDYTNFHVLYVDDGSTDGTGDAVAAYIEERELADRITLIRNPLRCGMLYNLSMAVHCCPDDVMVVVVDGDDWLADESVLTYLNEIYQDDDIWMTYGQFEEYPSGKAGFCKPIPETIKRAHAYRYYDWITSHLKTFYAGLFKKIPLGYLINNGAFLTAACDLAIMVPMLELASSHAEAIDKVLYIYNMNNGNSVFRTRPLEQLKNSYWVRSRQPLMPLASHPAQSNKSKDLLEVYNCHISLVSPPACADYLETLTLTDITPNHVMIWATPQRSDDTAAYEKVSALYGVQLTVIDDPNEFKHLFQKYLSTIPYDSGIVLTVDGCQWQLPWSSEDALRALHKTDALCYSTMRSVVDDPASLPPLLHFEPALWVWKCSEAVNAWHMPYALPGTLFLCKQLQKLLANVGETTAAACLDALGRIPPSPLDAIALCGTEAACLLRNEVS